MAANAHIIFKFDYFAWGNRKIGETIFLHEEIIEKNGAVWWGRTTGISVDRLETLKNQISDGIDTYAFLYGIKVPKKIHPDSNLWYRSKIIDIRLEKPKDISLIPSYYRERNDLGLYIKLKDIHLLRYSENQTPRLPNQASMRHCTYKKKPVPENLVSLNFPEQSLCKRINDEEMELTIKEQGFTNKHIKDENFKKFENDGLGLALKVIDLQDEITQLHQEIEDLKTYKEYYKKILSTDFLFSSERFFESWIQENIHKIIPELEIIDRQPYIAWPDGKFGRLDLLAVNKETLDLAVIEVKTRKRSKKSGYDQFLRYTTWVRNNRGNIKKKYSQLSVKPSQSPQFVIISDYVDEEMKAICKDHGIELFHIFGGLSVERAA